MIKSNSGKDIRDIVYPNNKHIFSFSNWDNYEIFLEFIYDTICWFGYITLEDILAYFSKSHDFISSKDYGWTLEDFENADYNLVEVNNEYIFTLPEPTNVSNIKLYINKL
ncbi:MAG: hypothetical protein IJ094_13110 [Bacilli bacterium]|nr:hypothetical protein [Bacilli bacterium]